MLAYLISRKHVPTKGVLCILELGLMQRRFFDTAHFLIACRNILFKVEVICYCLVKWITTSPLLP
jgi:hypothetical protein